MKYNNYDITKIYYSGYTVTAAYGCGGYKVYEETVPGNKLTISKITNPSQTYSIACDSSSILTQADIDECYSAITGCCVEFVVGDCITHIGSGSSNMAMFESNCVQSVILPDNLQYIGPSTFAGCWSLKSINIPSGITAINSTTFNDCVSLSSITLPSSVREIGIYAFRNCSGLTDITINAVTPPTIAYSSSKPFENTNNCPIYVPCASVKAYKQATNWTAYADRIQAIEKDCVPEYDFALRRFYTTSSGSYSPIKPCSALTISSRLEKADTNTTNDKVQSTTYSANTTNAIIGDCVQTIGNSAFNGWPKLSTVTISSGITNIASSAFYGCTALTSVTIYAETPPYCFSSAFDNTNNCPIYVLPSAVNAYKSASTWEQYVDRIQPIPT